MYENEYKNNNKFEEIDYVMCPNCRSNVAVISKSNYGLDVAHCKYDCGYKWHMLIEPDPFEWNEHGKFSPLVAFEGNIFDVEDVDYDRYERIIQYSDLSGTTFNLYKPDCIVPPTIYYRQSKFFERYYTNLSIERDNEYRKSIEEFLDGKYDVKNFIWILKYVCDMKVYNQDKNLIEYSDFNQNIENISCITFNEFNENKLRSLLNTELTVQDIKNHLNNTYGIPLLFNKYEKNVELSKDVAKPILENNNVEKFLFESEQKTSKEINNIEKNYEFEKFLSKETSYINKESNKKITIKQLYDLIKDCKSISYGLTVNPLIIDYNEYKNNLEDYINFNSLIDFKNNIVFLNISHKDLIETLSNFLNIDKFKNFDELEYKFHNETNTLQLHVAINNLVYATYYENNIENENLLKNVENTNKNLFKIEKINEKDDDLIVLNGSGKIKGKIYFPKENEENIPVGKILVIPTASEEYFLPSLSNFNKNGCIITEKGSKTSHLIIMSKEFDFNIILVKDAMKLFKQNDFIVIDLDKKTFKIKKDKNKEISNEIN